jgi:hypothetical protein
MASWRPNWASKFRRPYLRNETNKRVGGMAQVVKYLPSMCKALALVPSTTNNNKQNNKKLPLKGNKTTKAHQPQKNPDL